VGGITVRDSVFEDNGQGVITSQVDGASVVANRIRRHAGANASGIGVGETTRASVVGNWLEGNFRGILTSGSPGADIQQNTIVGTAPSAMAQGRDGIACLGKDDVVAGCTIVANTVRSSGGAGVVVRQVTRAHVVDNTIEDSGNRAILVLATSASEA